MFHYTWGHFKSFAHCTFSLRTVSFLCTLYVFSEHCIFSLHTVCFLCTLYIFSAHCTFSLLTVRFLCALHIFSVHCMFFLRTVVFSLPTVRFLCTLYVFFLKMNLFYKIHLQAFNVISIVLYHSGPPFGQVLYSCQDAFVVDASDYSGHIIRHLLNASEAFSTEWFLQIWEQVKGWWAHVKTVWRVGTTCHPHFSQISDTAPEA